MDCVQFPVDSTLQRTSGWICEWDINGSYCFDWSKVDDYYSDIDYSDVASHPDDCSAYQDTIDTETEEGSLNVVVIGVVCSMYSQFLWFILLRIYSELRDL